MATDGRHAQIRRALSIRQWEDLRLEDVSLLAEVGSLVGLSLLRAAVLENEERSKQVKSADDRLEIVLHTVPKGDVIDWETHYDELQFVFVAEGELRLSIAEPSPQAGSTDTTLAFVWPGDKHKLEALEDSRYASVYWKVEKPETWCRET